MVATIESLPYGTPRHGKTIIDGLRSHDGSLSRDAIIRAIPYNESFLFIDRITHLDEKSVVAELDVHADLPYLRGHFVDFPVMPGALMAEGVGQAGSLLIRYNLENPATKDILICRIEDARFKSHVVPGSTLTYQVTLGSMNRALARLSGEASIGARKIALFKMIVAIVDKETFRASNPDDL